MLTNKSFGHYGRAGNMFFQLAGICGIARKNNQPWCLPEFINYDHKERFGSNEEIDLRKYFINSIPEFQDFYYEELYVHWGYHDIKVPSGNWDLRGHFQSPKYFDHCLDEVRFYFKMPNEEDNGFTLIHWRAGDYEDNQDAYHPRLTKEYYANAMIKIPGPYLVCSDDIEGAKKMLSPLSKEIRYSGLHYMDDFKLMKNCRHFICGNSSLSVFAAILAENEDKKIVMPRKWFGPAANGLNANDLYIEGAIII